MSVRAGRSPIRSPMPESPARSSRLTRRGANTKRLIEELNPGCDPLGPENLLIFGIGPLTGTLLPASAYYTVSAKSPFTGILGDSAAGGQFAAEMKLTGFDRGVTVLGGVPIPIATPAHGTAFDIMGKGIAKVSAMRHAFDLACRMGLRRRRELS